MKKIFFLIVAALLASVPGPAQEDLHRQLSAAGTAKEFPGSSYLVVFDRTAVRVEESGLSHVDKEVLYKVLDSAGARELQSLTFGYDPLSAWVEVKEMKVLRANGGSETVPLTAVRDYPAPARAIYWGAREIIAPAGRLEPGDGVWVRTYQKGFTYALLAAEAAADPQADDRYIPPMKGHFYDIVPFYSRIPVKVKSYRLSLPAAKKLQFEMYNGQARHYAHSQGALTEYFWEVKDIAPFQNEADMVDPSDVAPKLLISTSPDWQAKSLWFFKVNEDYGSFEFDAEIKAKADEIVRGAKNDWEKISRLTHWVAEEIRYSGISMGPGEGYTLHKGTMTFRDRCGVCKDKAGMLITMLRAAGFESYPAMTMAGSRIDRIPADQFNHSVTLVKVDNQYHLLDPTWVPGVRELWSSAEQQQEYLMGVPEGADLASTPVSPAANHYVRYRLDSAVGNDGTLRGRVRVEAEGQSDSNLRRIFTRYPLHRWPEALQQEFFHLHPAARVSNVVFPDPFDIAKPMLIEFRVEIPGFLKQGERTAWLRPLSATLPFQGGLGFLRLNTALEGRKYPFRLRSSQLVEVRETMTFPGKWRSLPPPALKKVSGSGADFSGDFKAGSGSLSVMARLELKKRINQPGDWESVRNGVLEFRKIMETTLLLDRGGEK
jgi:transglutaminase-like putative cysteine protease